jgi:hypothetical protein
MKSTVRVTRRMSYMRQELFTLSRAPAPTPCFGVLLVFCVVFLFVLVLFLLCTMLQVSLECQFLEKWIFRSSQPVHGEGRTSYPRTICIVWPISIYGFLFPLLLFTNYNSFSLCGFDDEMLEICIQTSYDQNVQLILKSYLPVVYGTHLRKVCK